MASISMFRRYMAFASTFIAMAAVICMWLFSLYASRVALWDDVRRVGGRIDIERDSWYATAMSDRTAFGLLLCTVTRVYVDGLSDGNQLIKSLGDLNCLTTLVVVNSSVTDTGLRRLAQAPNLKILCLRGNAISDSAVGTLLRSLPSIEELYLQFTLISDALGMDLMDLPNLEVLNLEGTNVSGAAFCGHRWSGYVYHINLSKTNISCGPKINLPLSLRELVISENGDVSAIVENLGDLPKLNRLSICRCVLSGSNFEWLTKLSMLKTLLISDTVVASDLLRHLSSLSRLSYLDISRCTIDGPGWDAIRDLRSLKRLVCRGTDMRKMRSFQTQWASRVSLIDLAGSHLTGEEIGTLSKACGIPEASLTGETQNGGGESAGESMR